MMASRKESCESSQLIWKDAGWYAEGTIFSSSSDEEVTTGRHISRDTSKEHFVRKRSETDQQTGQDVLRRDENPFSFSHFLKDGTQVNYYNTGARPKVYSSSSSSVNNVEKDSGVYSRNPTELPDFVQDHLVIEQCYLNHETNQQPVFDVDNLPDFALNSVEQRHNRIRNETKTGQSNAPCDLPFDLTGNLDKEPQFLHLNLSAFENRNAEPVERSEASGFPFDLPIASANSDPTADGAAQACSSKSESNVPKSLPDFLNDGPIRNRTTLSTESGSNSNTTESSERRLMLENERLHRQLELAQKQISEKSKRIHVLESELASRRNLEHEETEHLEKAMEQVEDNLKRSTRRAVNAESTVTSMRKEIKNLTSEISLLRLENKELRAGMYVTGRNEFGSSNADRTLKRLATDLRTAASTAEVSLSQLMSGVDNLRVLASTLESVDMIEDRTKDFLLDFDEDNAAGPAL